MAAAERRCIDNITDRQLIPGKDFSDTAREVWQEL